MTKRAIFFGLSFVILLLLVPGVAAQSGPYDDHVIILVVDDFETSISREDMVTPADLDPESLFLPPDLETMIGSAEDNPGDLCFFNPSRIEGMVMADGMGGGVDANGDLIPHGILVISQIIDMLNVYQPNTSNITVIPVHLNNYNLAEIGSKIKATKDEIDATSSNVSYVINMSFALVPCDDYARIVAALNELNSHYELAISTDESEWESLVRDWADFRTEMASIVTTSHRVAAELCPYFDFDVMNENLGVFSEVVDQMANEINCTIPWLSVQPNVVAVASAGNFGSIYPTLPGAWETVVSVSASQECDRQTAASSWNYNFDSNSGSDNRLIFQAATFGPSQISTRRHPCTSTMEIIDAADYRVEFLSSSGELSMPGIWEYVTSIRNVQTLIASNDIVELLSDEVYRDYFAPIQIQDVDVTNFTIDMSYETGRPFAMGSSFAAPKASFAIALVLQELILEQVEDPFCAEANLGDVGFVYGEFPEFPYLIQLGGGPWLDLSLGDQTLVEASTGCYQFYQSSVPDILNLILR